MAALLLFTCLVVLGTSFLCSLTEAVLLSLNPLALRLRQSRDGDAEAGRWLIMKQRIERPISAILVFNTLANTGLATVAGVLFDKAYGSQWLWLFTLLLTLVILFGTEMAPKIIGVHHSERIAPRLIGPLSWMLRLCHPVVRLMDSFSRRVKASATAGNRPAGAPIMDIITLVQSARAEQLLHNREELIIIHAATLSARRVKSAMVPREAVHVFDRRLSLRDNVLAAGPRLHRSYPVSADGSLNAIVGYIRVRELFVQNLTSDSPEADWTSLIRPALRIDGRASLTQLLALFLEKAEVAALVDDPSDAITGWITMDDVTQVLMGARI